MIAGTHGKTTTTALTGWLLTGRRSIRACWSAASRGTSATNGSSYRLGQGRDFVIEGDEYDSAFFDKTAKFLKYLPDICRHQQRRVRSRGHLCGHGRRHAGVPAPRRTWFRDAGCCSSAPTARAALALKAIAKSRVETFGTQDGADWQAHDLTPSGQSTAFRVRRRGSPFGSVRGAAAGRSQRAQRACGDRGRGRGRGSSAERIARGPSQSLPA